MSLVFLLTFSLQSNAISIKQIARSLCEKHLIANDPWPFAKESVESLVAAYERTHSSEIKREMLFRIDHMFLNGWEVDQIMGALNGKSDDSFK